MNLDRYTSTLWLLAGTFTLTLLIHLVFGGAVVIVLLPR